MTHAQHHLAVDLGAGSGRVMTLDLGPDIPVLSEAYRFVGEPVETPTGVHWDMLRMLTDIRTGVAKALERTGGRAGSLAVDSWGVDYALLDERGTPLGMPYFYRDRRTLGADQRLRARLSDEELFRRTGSQPRAINTIYQLLAEREERPGALAAARRLAFIPDLVNHWLTGRTTSENTIAATSGLWDPATRDWNRDLITELGLPGRIFHPLEEPGGLVGEYTGIPVLLAPSHDTAAAIHGVQGEPGQVILSLGSWAIVSWVMDRPNLSSEAGRAGFAVEGCPRGCWRFARNHTGLWLVQRYRAGLKPEVDFGALELAAEQTGPGRGIVDVDAPDFARCSDMDAALRAALERGGVEAPRTPGGMVRLIYRSLAVAFANSIKGLAAVTGAPARSVRVIGGGARSALLTQMIADATGIPVIAGPVEATAWGNLLSQVVAVHGGTEAEWRRRFRPAWAERRHEPKRSDEMKAALSQG